MTESEWLTSEDPRAMLKSLRHEWDKGGEYYLISDRKLLLFACGCMRLAGIRQQRVDEVEVEGPPHFDAADRPYHPHEFALAWTERGSGKPTASVKAALLRDIVGNPFRPVVFDTQYRTPLVLSLALAAYEDRGDDGTLDPARLAVLSDALEEAGCDSIKCENCVDGDVGCSICEDKGYLYEPPYSLNIVKCRHCNGGLLPERCTVCNGNGIILHPLLAHLRSDGPHVRGCWALDMILDKC